MSELGPEQSIFEDFWWSIMMSSELAIWTNSQTINRTLEKKRNTAPKKTLGKLRGSILRSLPVFLTVPPSISRVLGEKARFLRGLQYFSTLRWSCLVVITTRYIRKYAVGKSHMLCLGSTRVNPPPPPDRYCLSWCGRSL